MSESSTQAVAVESVSDNVREAIELAVESRLESRSDNDSFPGVTALGAIQWIAGRKAEITETRTVRGKFGEEFREEREVPAIEPCFHPDADQGRDRDAVEECWIELSLEGEKALAKLKVMVEASGLSWEDAEVKDGGDTVRVHARRLTEDYEPVDDDEDGIDRTEGDCDGKCGPIVYEVADWKFGNPTGVYCDRCGYVFEYRGGYDPR